MHARTAPRHAAGFTLMELMIVVAIVGILAAIAFPSYNSYIAKTRRAIAKSMLSQIANRQEQYFADNKTYTADLSDLGYSAANIGVDAQSNTVAAGDAGAIYVLSVTAAATRTYTLQAAPAGAQAEQDEGCGSLTLNQAGTKGATGPNGASSCW